MDGKSKTNGRLVNKEVNLKNDKQPCGTSRLHSGYIIFENKIGIPTTAYEKRMTEVNRQLLARVLIQGSYINETGGIRSLFRLNVVKDCTLVRLSFTTVSLGITQVSLNNVPVTLFTVRFQRRKWEHHSDKKSMLHRLHFTLSLHYAD